MTETININMDSLIQSLPNFEAKREQDIEFFLEQFDKIAQATKLNDDLKLIILRTKLAGNAKQILINTPELRSEDSYNNFKVKLIENFKTEKSFAEAQNKFSNIKQLPAQTIEDFAKQFQLSAQKYLSISGHAKKVGAKDLLETIKLTKFIEALRPDIAFEVQKASPENFNEALKIAKRIEIAMNNSKMEINTLKQSKETPMYDAFLELAEKQNQQINDLKEQLNALTVVQKTPTTKENKFCHICEKNNHETKDCFYNKKSQNNKNPSNEFPQKQQKNLRQGFRSNNFWQKNTKQNRPINPNQHQQYQNFSPQWQYNSQIPPYFNMPWDQNATLNQLPTTQQWGATQNYQQNRPFYTPYATFTPNNAQNTSTAAQPAITYNNNGNQNTTTNNSNTPETNFRNLN